MVKNKSSEVDTGRHTVEPEYKLGARYTDKYGRPWVYVKWQGGGLKLGFTPFEAEAG